MTAKKAFDPKDCNQRPQASQRKAAELGLVFAQFATALGSLWLKALALLLVLSAVSMAARTLKPATLTWQPVKLVNGSPVLFELSTPAAVQSVTGNWLGHQLVFFRSGSGRKWSALAGVPVETAPAVYQLRVSEDFGSSKSAEITKNVRIARATYPKITVHVAKQFTEPNPEQVREINADKEVKQKIFTTTTQERLWAGRFEAPVSSAVSDVFGTARVFNDAVQSRHLGLDFAAPAGTPVHAVNRGTVILARPLYFEGGCIVIDHGQGLMSLYLHLSDFRVKEGDEVDAGQLIALSGGSGRATGPHLHLAIRWQGVYLNPAILLKMQLP